MSNHLINAHRQGFKRDITASGSKVTLPRAKGKDLLDYVIKGRSEKAVTIDGVEYGVPDGYTVLLNGIGNKNNYATIPSLTIDTTDTLYAEFTLSNNGNRMFGNQSANTRCYVAQSGNGTSMFCGKTYAVPITEWTIDGSTINTLEMDASGITVNGNEHDWSSGTLAQDVVTNFGINENIGDTSGTTTSVSGFCLFLLKDSSGNHKNAVMFLKKDSDNSVVCYDFAKKVFYAVTGTLTAGKTTKTVVVEGQSIEVPLFHYRGVRDKTANEFNKDDSSILNSFMIHTATVTAHTDNKGFSLKLTEGETYTVSKSNMGRIYVGASANPFANGTNDHLPLLVQQSSTSNATFTVPLGKPYIDIVYWHRQNDAGYTESDVRDTLMLVKGTTAPSEHIPYGYDHHIVTATGGKVNLGTMNFVYRADLGTGEFIIKSSMLPTPKASGRMNVYINGYTTINSTGTGMGDMTVCGHDYYGHIYIRNTRFTNEDDFKAAMSGKYLYYQRATDDSFSVNHYHVYTDEQGFSCGNIADEVSYLNGDVLNTLQMSFDGTEGWTENGGAPGLFQLRIDGSKPQNTSPYNGKCSGHFKTTNKAASALIDGECSFQGQMSTEGRISVRATGYSRNLDGFLAMLRAQSENGTPLWICAERLTPATKAISAPVIKTTLNDIHVEVLTITAPSGVEVVGYSGVA